MNILVINNEGLIGDFLGTVPSMQKLLKRGDIFVKCHPEIKGLFDLCGLKEWKGETIDKDYILDVNKAFAYSNETKTYMSQAFMNQVEMPVADIAPKAVLYFDKVDCPVVDYLISPFGRSLPPSQKWPVNKWQKLIDNNSSLTFGILGNSKHDPLDFIIGKNVIELYDKDFNTLCNIFVKARKGLISLVTGTSHLSFHLGVKNILLTNQGVKGWGINPEAVCISTPLSQLTVKEVQQYL